MQTIKAQQKPEWFQVGAEWTYSWHNEELIYGEEEFFRTFYTVTCVGDSIDGEKHIKFLDAPVPKLFSHAQYPMDNHNNAFYYDETTDIVYGT